MPLGEQRLVGAVDWAQQGRSFDGFRYTTPSMGKLKVELFGMRLQEASASTHEDDASFVGAYGTMGLSGAGTLDLYGLFTHESRDDGNEERTFGGLWKGRVGPLNLRLEGSLQSGTRNGTDVSAYMVGARAGMTVLENATVTLWYDHLSGDEDPSDDQIGVFNTLFATNHAFYGLADYFLNVPAHTGGLGLNDAAVKLALTLFPWTDLNLDLHRFQTAQEGSLSTRALANELDLTLIHRLSQDLTLVSGYSYVQAKDGMKELGRLSEDAHWLYLMLNAVF